MPDTPALQACRAEHLPAVIELLNQLAVVSHSAPGYDLTTVETLFAQMQNAPEFYFNLVAIAGGRVVGFISVIFYKTMYHKGGTALINELVVDQCYRGAGIGKAIIAAVVAEAKQRGMDEVEVGTEKDNHPAQQFYHRCGFDEEYLLLGMEF